MKSKLRDKIEYLYTKYFKDADVILASDRNEIYKGYIQLWVTNRGISICFSDPCNISQDEFNELNLNYGIIVHFDHKHNKLEYDISKCKKINAKNIENPINGYYRIENLEEKDSIYIFNKLRG